MTLKPQLCDDEGCPHHRIKHIDVEHRDRIVAEVRADLMRRSKLGLLKHGAGPDCGDPTLVDALRHAHEEVPDLASHPKCAINVWEGK